MLEHLGHAHIRSISYDDKDRWRALCLRVELARSDAEDRLQPSVAADLEKAIDYSMKLPIMEANRVQQRGRSLPSSKGKSGRVNPPNCLF